MSKRINILLQTTIPPTEDDWNVGRFSQIKDHLESLKSEIGEPLYEITARNRESNESGDDKVLSKLDETDFDELWLFAVDVGDGLTPTDCAGITRFRQRGGGILATRDHQDLGSSLCTLGGLGDANYFHSRNLDPDESRRCRDDQDTLEIDFPNYHSGANGDYQVIEPVGPIHELLVRPDRTPLRYFPAHPHEGGVGAPPNDASARVIATGTSKSTGREFNIAVAFEASTDRHGNTLGAAAVESTFHHFADYNWNPDLGCPTFVAEAPSDGYAREPEKLNDIKQYVSNLARWLAPRG